MVKNENDLIDEQVLKRICGAYKVGGGWQVSLDSLYTMKLEKKQIWASLSRLIKAKKIKKTGSHRCKGYKPLEAAS